MGFFRAEAWIKAEGIKGVWNSHILIYTRRSRHTLKHAIRVRQRAPLRNKYHGNPSLILTHPSNPCTLNTTLLHTRSAAHRGSVAAALWPHHGDTRICLDIIQDHNPPPTTTTTSSSYTQTHRDILTTCRAKRLLLTLLHHHLLLHYSLKTLFRNDLRRE